MPPPPVVLNSFVAGRWIGATPDTELAHAVSGEVVALTPRERPDAAESVAYARRSGLDGLLALDFQQRASILRALAKALADQREALYAISAWTGATRGDSRIDIDGGLGTLTAYAGIGAAELPSGNLLHEGPAAAIGRSGQFAGTHVLVPRRGVAVHINAFNFPVWGLLEKFAPAFLAGMPCIVKPATTTAYLAEALVRRIDGTGLLPQGALQLVIGSLGDLLDHLGGTDVVTFTGSADTAALLRTHPAMVRRSVSFNAEADSLNAAILGPDVVPGQPEFGLFVDEVVREMTVKAGQKCTAIRRVLVPRDRVDAVASALRERLAAVVVGDPSLEGVQMGALASLAQQRDVGAQLTRLAADCATVFGARDGFAPRAADPARGAFFAPTLLHCPRPHASVAVHDVEAFGPVSTLMPYDDLDDATALAARGGGSLVVTLATASPQVAAQAVPRLAATHGRVHVLDARAAPESTGHGSPLPTLKHGGPGRAGGGEELGGLRAVTHYLQRAAVQGSPTMLTAVTGEYVRGADVNESDVHPFRRHFEDIAVGDSLLTHRRTVSEADIVMFGGLSGDYFYMHFDEPAARASPFGRRIAHGYFVLSAAAGLFVWPSPGPVLANYGLDTLRFVKPVGIGDTIQARLTCKRKTDRPRKSADDPGQGVVAWDVQVTNQDGTLVASYDILTLVAKRPTD